MKSTTTTGINRSFPSFDYFLEKRRRISQFSQKRQDELNLNCLTLFNYWGGYLEDIQLHLQNYLECLV